NHQDICCSGRPAARLRSRVTSRFHTQANPKSTQPPRKAMIAQLKFRYGQKPVTARLTEALQWNCDNKEVETYLNQIASLPQETHKDIRQAPRLHLYRLAYRLGAQVEISGH